jgi:hypothetical protein
MRLLGSAAALSIAAAMAQPNQMTVTLTEDVPGIGGRGDVVALTLSPSDVTISEEMNTLMTGFRNQGMRGDEACPIQLVEKDTGQFRSFGLNNAFKLVAGVLSSIQADIPEVDVESSLVPYTVQERALGGFVPAVTELNAAQGSGLYDPRDAVARRIKMALDLEREVRVWTLLTTTGSWNANNRAALGAGVEWNDPDNGDPLSDIMDRLETSGQIVTDTWCNPIVAHAIIRSKSIRDHLRTLVGDSSLDRSIQNAAATQTAMDFQLPGLPPIHVVSGKVLNETTGNLDFILGNSFVLTGQPPGAQTTGEDIMTCKTFRRRGPSGTGYTTREFPLDRRGLNGGIFMASGHAEQVAMISGVVGGLITNIIQ